MTEIERPEARIAKLKCKEQFLADLKDTKCPFCGGDLDYKVDFNSDFYGYTYDAKGKIFCTGCGCFGKEYETHNNDNRGSESNTLNQFEELACVLATLKRYSAKRN